MNELDRYLDAVCASVSGPASLRQHLREELREHLESAAAAHRAAGLDEPGALARAIAEFGDSQAVRAEFQGLYGRRVLALFVERALDWKERNMKSDWKWSFTAQVTLLLIIGILAAWMAGVMVFITPLVEEQYHTLDLKAPAHFATTVSASRFIEAWMAVWLVLAVAGAVLFEIRCRKDYKGTIRLATTALVALVFTAAALVESSSVGIAMVQVRRGSTPPPSATVLPAPDPGPLPTN